MTLPFRLRRIAAVARVELLRIAQDPPTLSLILVVPAIQILLFGYAVNLDPHDVPIAIARELPRSPGLLDRSIAETGRFRIVADGLPPGGALELVNGGRALIGIELPPDIDPATSEDVTPAPRAVIDASDPGAVRPAALALEAALLRNSARISHGNFWAGVKVDWLYNPEGRTAWSLAPGLAGVVVMITMLLLGALTLVREREQGSWESLLATPVEAADALVGKLSPYVILGVLQAATVIYLAHWLLQVPLRGNVGALLLGAALLAAAHLILGFALSALAESQLQAIQGAVFFYLPSMLLSGFMFPFEGMPRWAQALGSALPLTHFVRAARGVLLRGENAAFVFKAMLPVALFTAIATGLALVAYRRRLD
jgi:ABC-2 type transport system permease protein